MFLVLFWRFWMVSRQSNKRRPEVGAPSISFPCCLRLLCLLSFVGQSWKSKPSMKNLKSKAKKKSTLGKHDENVTKSWKHRKPLKNKRRKQSKLSKAYSKTFRSWSPLSQKASCLQQCPAPKTWNRSLAFKKFHLRRLPERATRKPPTWTNTEEPTTALWNPPGSQRIHNPPNPNRPTKLNHPSRNQPTTAWICRNQNPRKKKRKTNPNPTQTNQPSCVPQAYEVPIPPGHLVVVSEPSVWNHLRPQRAAARRWVDPLAPPT